MTEQKQSGSNFHDEVANARMAPLWEVLHTLVPRQPASAAVPHHWPYRTLTRPLLMRAGEYITAHDAERRVLILENPGLPGKASITGSLYAGLQLVLPGEVAPAHRHTQSALRFIIEGGDAFTAIEGEKTMMNPGDLVITPAWHWHDHGNETADPMIWLDALDIPLVSFFDAGFAEPGDADSQRLRRAAGDSSLRFGNNLAPVDWKPSVKSSPIFNYPYLRTRETLEAMSRGDAPDPCHGFKLRYINPANGGHVTPTLAAFMQYLPAGFLTQAYRSTDGTVFCVVEGTGQTQIGDGCIRWSPHDVFVAPSWTSVIHQAERDAVLFSFSDRAAQEALGLWREARVVVD